MLANIETSKTFAMNTCGSEAFFTTLPMTAHESSLAEQSAPSTRVLVLSFLHVCAILMEESEVAVCVGSGDAFVALVMPRTCARVFFDP